MGLVKVLTLREKKKSQPIKVQVLGGKGERKVRLTGTRGRGFPAEAQKKKKQEIEPPGKVTAGESM